jgi:hypothetical protein
MNFRRRNFGKIITQMGCNMINAEELWEVVSAVYSKTVTPIGFPNFKKIRAMAWSHPGRK